MMDQQAVAQGKPSAANSAAAVMRFARLWLVALMVFGAVTASAQVARLPGLKVDLNQTSVSGLSAGGYMAVQFHVAHSAIVKGAGVIAGGPYFCAKDDQNIATTVCSCTGLTSCQPDQAAQAVPISSRERLRTSSRTRSTRRKTWPPTACGCSAEASIRWCPRR